MEVYDNRYFFMNKRVLRCVGLWPYDPRKTIVKTSILLVMVILTVPNMIALVVHFHDVDMLMEQLNFILVMLVNFMKIFTLGIAEEQMKFVYVSLADNWIMITAEDEKKILKKYSERGRTITIVYTAYLLISFATFVIPPAIPALLNLINPLPEPRPYVYIFESEFLLDDKDAHYLKIYIWDVLYMLFMVVPPIACDSMYSVVNEHCVALYSIVRYRLSKLRKMKGKDSTNERSGCYEWLVGTIKLHNTALSFTRAIEETYSTCFFVLAMEHIVCIPLLCIFIVSNMYEDLVRAFRFVIFFIGMLVHLFMIFWPGQKILDFSTSLVDYAFDNEWYETTLETQKILRLFMLKCMEPTLLSAGGLIELNFANYLKIVKTAASYITVFSSFRY